MASPLYSRPSSSISALRELLSSTLRITVTDGRIFLGTFIGTDQPMNILLTETEEHRLDGDEGTGEEDLSRGRFVGQVLIPWKIIQKIEVQEPEKPASNMRTRTNYSYNSMEYI
ncbi:hypothetical protein BT96DRAFT_50808 [Gymnopus androsaceus JB14]|uniref:Sm domain-containing protein n=1 Tax=Gymnopus androsaceus JB14 TaxID=1447944 RepID=A0A6A4HIG8_9AGAR|nr:hypothetical protein BT96DRAFT_50808 [Gymnopus androsaceus JB14]